MADVAQLGIQVRTDGATRATGELNNLSGAAARAEASTEGLAAANRGAAGAASSAAQAYAREGAAAATASKQIEMMNRAANQNIGGVVKVANTANLAAQGFDIVTTAASGMNAGIIGLQQGLQIAQVAMMSTDGFAKTLAASFAAMLAPITFLSIGLTALVALLIQLVPWTKLAASALTGLADILDEVAPYAVAAAAALALLYAPTIIGGIISLIAWLGRLVTQLGMLAAAFALANPALAFIAGLTAAVAAAVIFRDELATIFGRDIVADAKRGANLVIGSFVAAYEDIKFVWNNFGNIIGKAIEGAVNAVIRGVNEMVKQAATGIDALIGYANSALPESLQMKTIGDVGDVIAPWDGGFGDLGGAIDARSRAVQDALSRDYLGDFASGVTEYASKGAAALKDLAGWMEKVDEKGKKSRGKSEAERYEDIVNGANRRISSLQAERDALGLTEQAAAKLRFETDLLNQAQQRGITLTASQRAELSGLAERMASLEVGTKAIKDQMEFAKDTTRGFLDDFRSGLERGEGLWRSFGDAALGVLDRITDKLLNEVLDAVFKVNGAGGSSGGGFFGFLGSLFGMGVGGSSAPSWLNNGFDTSPMAGYAAGTPSARPGVAWVGEKGPELVRFKGGEEVIPNHRIISAANQNGSAQQTGSGDVTVSVPINIDATGADAAELARVRREVETLRKELPGRIVDGVRDAQKRRVI
ncbi:hypothetical protein [Rhizobium sp. LC145]|uniref:hypothetical protein n=1 Tax=Rhizobium sp. LC145 TaxID=1120688 RepID=UPI00069B4B13|nr:hypothetical protein [Rhizobium sp. LC145]TKT45309.1 phage tail tape-measure protein [Rhizobiaceae bacterium LC148]